MAFGGYALSEEGERYIVESLVKCARKALDFERSQLRNDKAQYSAGNDASSGMTVNMKTYISSWWQWMDVSSARSTHIERGS